MKLFCWIIDKSKEPFPVNVENDDTVDDLKEVIMKKKPHALAGLDADLLSLWKVGDFFNIVYFMPYLPHPRPRSLVSTRDIGNA